MKARDSPWCLEMFWISREHFSKCETEFKSTLCRKFETYIPRNETARLRSQFLHSCICERFIYSQDQSSADRSWEYINRAQIHECGNRETEHYNFVLEITRSQSFISGNTPIGTRHLYWILTGPSFACRQILWAMLAGVLDEPYSQLTQLSVVAVQPRQPTLAGTVSILCSLAGRYGYSAELA